ncbi:MAG: hypothetical protein HY815_09820, partial [Candidatus Riflebacteria bacterium]|nr:hypothetical protein [Candidatus Riflebacteria bacterium]
MFPIRHHSPVSARALVETIRSTPLSHILIEGPADANRFMQEIVSPGTVPPVALLYFLRGKLDYVYPLCAYSPEYQAMVTGRELGIPTLFCDLPYRLSTGSSGSPQATDASSPPGPGGVPDLSAAAPERPIARVARALGHASFDDLWRHEFEGRQLAPHSYLEAVTVISRALVSDDPESHTREAHMMAVASNLVESGVRPESILLVCGAAHAQALITGSVDFSLLGRTRDLGDPGIYLVPYSFPRLSSVLGYGAGVVYPGFHQAVWEAAGQVDAAVCRILVEVGRDLAALGHDASPSDVIDGLTLATNLAALRGRASPGPEEIVRAVESCLTRGQYGQAHGPTHRRLVGERMGKVRPDADCAPLTREFYDFVNRPQHSPPLALGDVPTRISLTLSTPAHRNVSRFLHRLCLASIPFATPIDVETDPGGPGRSSDLDPGDVSVVQRRSPPGAAPKAAPAGSTAATIDELASAVAAPVETWVVQWEPRLETALVDRSMLGETLEQVAITLVGSALEEASDVWQAARILIATDRAGLPKALGPAVERVQALASSCTDFALLARSCGQLLFVLRYGDDSGARPGIRELVRALASRAASSLLSPAGHRSGGLPGRPVGARGAARGWRLLRTGRDGATDPDSRGGGAPGQQGARRGPSGPRRPLRRGPPADRATPTPGFETVHGLAQATGAGAQGAGVSDDPAGAAQGVPARLPVADPASAALPGSGALAGAFEGRFPERSVRRPGPRPGRAGRRPAVPLLGGWSSVSDPGSAGGDDRSKARLAQERRRWRLI